MRGPSSAALAAKALLLCGLGGCATLTGNSDQMVLVQTIQDNRELTGAGCILSNDVGKWFVTTPGRITIRKSQEPLKVDCRKHGSPAIATDDHIDPKRNALIYLVYSDRLIDGSPKNSVTAVPVPAGQPIPLR